VLHAHRYFTLQEGNSALMAAVQGGPKLHMAVATLLNAWRPKVDVNFAKPSGHTVIFLLADGLLPGPSRGPKGPTHGCEQQEELLENKIS